MGLGFAVMAAPPLALWLVSLFDPRWRPTEEAMSGYFFGVLAGMLAIFLAR
jgi:hypothetical protein